jgi:hypothetical protein
MLWHDPEGAMRQTRGPWHIDITPTSIDLAFDEIMIDPDPIDRTIDLAFEDLLAVKDRDLDPRFDFSDQREKTLPHRGLPGPRPGR